MRLKPEPGYPFYELRNDWKIPRELLDIAKRRVGGLSQFDAAKRMSLVHLLANAYLLGLSDGIDIFQQEEVTK